MVYLDLIGKGTDGRYCHPHNGPDACFQTAISTFGDCLMNSIHVKVLPISVVSSFCLYSICTDCQIAFQQVLSDFSHYYYKLHSRQNLFDDSPNHTLREYDMVRQKFV